MASKIKSLISLEANKIGEERYRQMIETSHAIIWTTDINGQITFINSSLEEITGFLRSSWIQNKFSSQVNTTDKKAVNEFFNLAIQGSNQQYEAQITDSQNNDLILMVNTSPSYEEGVVTGTVNFGRDITKRKKAEEQLSESNYFNETLLLNLPYGIDIVDEDGYILFSNHVINELAGYDIKGQKCWDIYKDNKKQCQDCPLKKSIVLGKTIVTEVGGTFGNKSFEITHTGMMFKGKKALLEVFHDVTLRKKAELELKNAFEKAKESDCIKSAFLATMSHELRTPLNAIIGFSDLIDIETPIEQIISFGNIINDSGNNLLEIINNILETTLIETKEINIHKRLIIILPIMVNINEAIKADIFVKGKHELDLKFSPLTTDPELSVYTDTKRVEHILLNLLKNAIKFTHKGSIEWGYLKESINDKTYIKFFVKDTGIGINKDIQSVIFDKFVKGDVTISKLYGGTGMGLSVAKNLVSILGGEIWFESEEGKGTTFHFTIPME